MKCGFPSLQELTFNIIIKEFSRYSSAYSTTTNRDLKKSLHFLQRVYTQRLFSELVRTECLEKQHLDFVINEYLKKLDIGILFKLFEKEVVFDKVSKIGHSLVELLYIEYSRMGCIDTFKGLVPYCSNVTKICIPYKCDDELLNIIAVTCFQLSELDCTNSEDITDVGLLALCQSKSKSLLKILRIEYTLVTWNAVRILLENISTLQEVEYNQLPDVLCSIHNEDNNNAVEKISNYNLTYIDFTSYGGYSEDSPKLASYLAMCSKLCPLVKKLNVYITKTEELQMCCQFLELEDITIEGDLYYGIERSTIVLNDFLLVKGSKLKNIEFSGCILSMSTLIAHCFNVEILKLNVNKYQKLDDGISLTSSLPNLKCVEFDLFRSYCYLFLDSIIMLLNSSPNLKSVSFCNTNFDRESNFLGQLLTFFLSSNIRHITFHDGNVNIDILELVVMNCNALESLCLKVCHRISSEDIEMLKQTIVSYNKCIEITYIEKDEYLEMY